MKKNGLLGLAAAFTVGALALAGCAPQQTEATAASADIQQGGTLLYVESGVIPSAAPQARSTFQEANVRYSLVDQLVFIDPETKVVKPWLAESWEVNDEATEFTFTLKDGVTHSDGTPVDAENVKNNFDYFGFGDADKGVPKSRYFIGYVGTEVIDPLTVKVKLDTPNALFLEYLGIPDSGINANAYLELSGEEQADFNNVIGSGPFVVESYTPDEELVLVKRDDYAWSYEGSSNPGAAYLDEVVIRFSLESAARAGLVTSNQADLVRGIAPSDEEQIIASGAQILPAALGVGGGTQIFARPDHPLLTDERVRKALQIGYDREAIVSTVLSESYIPAKSSLNAGSFGFLDQSDAIAFDQDAAAELLDDAGWVIGDDGIRTKDGQRLSLVVSGSAQGPAIKRVFELVAQQLKEIGVELDISKVGDQAFWVSSQTDPEVPLFSVRIPTPDSLLSLSAQAKDYLLLKGSDKAFETLLTDTSATVDDAARASLFGEIQDYLSETGYSLPLYDEVQVFAASDRVNNATFTPTAHPNLHEIWLTQ